VSDYVNAEHAELRWEEYIDVACSLMWKVYAGLAAAEIDIKATFGDGREPISIGDQIAKFIAMSQRSKTVSRPIDFSPTRPYPEIHTDVVAVATEIRQRIKQIKASDAGGDM